MLIAASAILLVLGVLAYRRNLRPGGSAWLLAVRVLILLLFAAVFIGAVFTRVWTERPQRVAVMLDVSESMNAVRAESAAAAVAASFPLPAGDVRQEWAFADTAEVRSQEPKARSQSGERTRVGAALAAAGKTHPGAVVLLSDGQDNGETDPVTSARDIGVPVYTVGFGGAARRNARVEQMLLPAAVYSGDTVEVQVRVSSAEFADERARISLRGEAKEAVLGQAMAEQDVPFRVSFARPGRQVIETRVDSMPGEANYADNTRSVTVDVRPGRVRVAYVTNRPGPDARMMLRALSSDDRIEVVPDVAVTGDMKLENGGQSLGAPASDSARYSPRFPDVFILDDVVETGSPDVWQSIADQVRAGAGVLVLAGPDFQPGQSVGRLLNGAVGRAQTGTFTPELAAEGGILPWFGSDAIDLSEVPPFVGLRPFDTANRPGVWLVAQENRLPVVMAERSGRGKVVYVAAYPLWRWGFGPEQKPDQASPLAIFVTGVVRYLAERDTSPFWLETDRPDLYRGQPARLILRAVAPDGRPWTGLSAVVQIKPVMNDERGALNAGSTESAGPEAVAMPMTETGNGVYEATIEALAPGRYRAIATVENRGRRPERDAVLTSLGLATTEFAVADQAVELANTGMNEGLLRAIAEASGGRFYSADSLPRDANEIVLGSYQRRFSFDPKRAVWAYVLIALLAGAEWLLRRRRGLL